MGPEIKGLPMIFSSGGLEGSPVAAPGTQKTQRAVPAGGEVVTSEARTVRHGLSEYVRPVMILFNHLSLSFPGPLPKTQITDTSQIRSERTLFL